MVHEELAGHFAMEAARCGARVRVTHRWGSVDPEKLDGIFRRDGFPTPRIEECDASDPEQTNAMVKRLYTDWSGLNGIVSGVAFAAPVEDIGRLRRGSLRKIPPGLLNP